MDTFAHGLTAAPNLFAWASVSSVRIDVAVIISKKTNTLHWKMDMTPEYHWRDQADAVIIPLITVATYIIVEDPEDFLMCKYLL